MTTSAAAPPGASTRVLLVEDEDAHAELVRRAFDKSAQRYSLQVVPTLAEARTAIEREPPDLVISDLRLPDGDGVDLVPPNRGQARYPVVIMTSHGDERVAVEAMKVGAIDYVVKSEETFLLMPMIAERALRGFRLIVERRQAEDALREREEHFRSLIENASDLISIIDEAGVIHYMSPSSRRILGYAPEAMLNQDLLPFLHADDRDNVRRALADVVDSPGERRSMVVRVRTENGRWRVLEAAGTARSGPGARRIVVNSRDITERTQAEEATRRLEAQLRQSQKLEILGTLAGGIAHDFNNNLQAIQGCAELARMNSSSEKAILYLDRLLEASRRGGDLVRQILTFGRRGEQDRRNILVAPVLHETAELARATFPAAIEVRCESRTNPTVFADPTQVHQVIMNLCTNAQHAMQEQSGVLELRLDTVDVPSPGSPAGLPAGRYARIGVRDTGTGMTPEVQERIFEPFFTTKGIGKGTGLGLSVVHGIVTSHGGAIAVDSRLGAGTLFQVFLPEIGGELRPQPAHGETPDLSGRRILCVDDQGVIASSIKELLERHGARVVAHSDPVAALEAARADRLGFQLAVIDRSLPKMSGLELAQKLREVLPQLCVVITSGFGEALSPAALQAAGASGYLAKPFGTAELLSALAQALKTHAGRAS